MWKNVTIGAMGLLLIAITVYCMNCKKAMQACAEENAALKGGATNQGATQSPATR